MSSTSLLLDSRSEHAQVQAMRNKNDLKGPLQVGFLQHSWLQNPVFNLPGSSSRLHRLTL